MRKACIFISILVLILFLGTISPAQGALDSENLGQKRAYYDICKNIPNYEDCNSMQGMTVLGDYIYTAKKNAGDNKAVIFRTHRFSGVNVLLSIDGGKSVDYLGHANDMCAVTLGKDSYLFVTSMKKSVGALVCYKIADTKLSLVGIYNVYTSGGSNLTVSGVDVYKTEGDGVTLFLAQGDLVFMGTIHVTEEAGNVYCPLGFQIDRSYMQDIARQVCGYDDLEMTIQGSAFYHDTYYMPISLHHDHSTQIKVDNHADTTSVIVAFPNISDAITVMDRNVKASFDESIYIPDAGEMFFEVESVDFTEGILYFSTNRVRIDHSVTTVSFLLDPTADVDILSKRASFRQDGIYMLSGAKATDHVLYDPGTEDKSILGGKYEESIHTYFGFESNEEGFYYIRSMLTKEYLTVLEDGTVTKTAKRENDPAQLFCLTQVNWPEEAGHVAIISLLNYQYLNNDGGTTKLITTSGGKTYRLKAVKDLTSLENLLFDYTLYTACYPHETAGMNEVQAKNHFMTIGKAKGYIGSIFFDPEYYLSNNPDVAAHGSYGTPEGAYGHFVEHGFWEGRQGSLFFSVNEYLHRGNDKLKKGDYPDKLFYIKHFRNYGANESLTRADRYGSDEFPIQEVVARFGLKPAGGYDFLVDYISRNVKDGESEYLYGLNPELQALCPHNTPATATQEPTCAARGCVTTFCCDCGGILSAETSPALGHVVITDKAIAPTKDQSGLTEGMHCGRCHLILAEQQGIPSLRDNRRTYFDLCEDIPTVEGCNSMQGMALLEDYVYTVKVNSANTKAVLFRTNRLDGTTVQMTVDGKAYATNLKHANDMCAGTVEGKDYLFVATLEHGIEAVVAYEINGTALSTLGVYDLYTAKGDTVRLSGINIYEIEDSRVRLLVTSASYSYLTTIDVKDSSKTLICYFAFQLGNILEDAKTASNMSDVSITVQGSFYADGVFYMPVGLGHAQIKPDNHGDSDYVILVYPNIDEAIRNQTIGLRSDLEKSIFIPDSGEIFFELEALAVEDGVIYFNTNRIFLNHSITSVSFLADRNSQTELAAKRNAYSQDGLYILRGAGAKEFVLVDPGAEDGHLTCQKITPDESTYFGFESNENGYYYIRSHRSGLYLTVNGDHSLTQSAKRANDPSQLWCIKQVDWPDDPSHVAVVSMLNYEYLNVDSSNMTVLTTTGGKTFRLEEFRNTETLEEYLFDYTLYTACYPEETAGMNKEEAKTHWENIGRKKGYIASIFFDPQYYLSKEPEIALQYGKDNYEKAYEHFVSDGFWEGRQGSLFFDCKDYINYVNFKYNQSYYPNKVNFLRHFYLYGAEECLSRKDVVRRGSEEFDLRQVAISYGLDQKSGYEFLVDYISNNIQLSRVSTQEEWAEVLFHWEDYLAKYPILTESRLAQLPGLTYEEKLYSHWLRYGIREGRVPGVLYDPHFYMESYSDVPSTASEAYAHYISTGLRENRQGSVFYNGMHYLYGLNPSEESLCDHIATVTVREDPKCTEEGRETVYCCYCTKVLVTKSLSAKGHDPVVDEALPPTCTSTGLTEGSHCSHCKEILVAQLVLPTLEHSYKADITEATCNQEGKIVYTCVCGESYTETLTILSHETVFVPMIPPTCTEGGQKEHYRCTHCGTVFADAEGEYPLPLWYLPIASFGHLCQHIVTEPTCTEKGFTTYICQCGESYISEEVDALGHREVITEALAPTCTSTGLTEGKFCSVCKEVLTVAEVLPARGHSYTYGKIDAKTHKVLCDFCDAEEVTSHVYIEGLCICGDMEIKEPVLDNSLKLNHSLNLASDISVNFVVPAYLLEGYEISTVYAESTVENYEGETFLGTETVRMLPVEMGSYYYFTLTGMTAVQMNDTISTVLYGEKNGQPYFSDTDLYSVAQYAYSQMNKSNSTEALKTLCADLLRYGAWAQSYKEYRLSSLADARLTEEHKSYLSDLEAVTFGNNSTDLGDLANAPITWVGKTLDLDSKVCLKFVFSIANYNGELSDLSMRVSYRDIYGEEMKVTVTEVTSYDTARYRYAFTVDALLASELREVLSVQIFAGDIPLSTTFRYSADTFGNNKDGALLELCKALFAYSDSAKAYFGK